MVWTLLTKPWVSWVGLRYLRSKKNSKFLSLITLISILGVALGVTAMIVVLSVMDGFETELKKRLMATDLHILVSAGETTAEPTFNAKAIQEKIKGIIGDTGAETNPVLTTEVMLRSGKKVAGVVLKGVQEERIEKLKTQVTEFASPQMRVRTEGGQTVEYPLIFVGQELAYDLQLIPGDMVQIISPTMTEGPLSSVPRMKRFVVEGVYHSGLPEQELHTLFTKEASVRSFLRGERGFEALELTLTDFERAPSLAKQLKGEFDPSLVRVQDWSELNGHLFASLRLERFTMFVILAFIVVVASFNIVTTLTLMVLEKKKEIGILKTMGASQVELGAVFLGEGLLIGLSGILGGLGLGFGLCYVLKRYEFIELPDVYYDRNLPVTFNGGYYLGVALVALVIVLVACLYPSRRASRLAPLDGIRFG